MIPIYCADDELMIRYDFFGFECKWDCLKNNDSNWDLMLFWNEYLEFTLSDRF